jgi:hypothetical protein
MKSVRSLIIFQEKIVPSFPTLSNLLVLSGHTELDKSILDKVILLIYKIISCILNNNFDRQYETIWNVFSQYSIIDNIYSLFDNFVNYSSSENINSHHINNETFKTILKIFSNLSIHSAEISNSLVKLNILETITEILKAELESQGKVNNHQHLIFLELFPFLVSLFPLETNSEKDKYILTKNESSEYRYFSTNIMILIIKNFINISSISTTLKALKLIRIYLFYSSPENISVYFSKSKLTNVLWSKFL